MKIIFKKPNSRAKNPKHLKKKIFIIYSPRKIKIESATSLNVDTEIIVSLPENSKGFIVSLFRKDGINLLDQKIRRLWMEILNKYFVDTIEIKRHRPSGLLVIEPEHSNMRQ